jgi:hypothetical protein
MDDTGFDFADLVDEAVARSGGEGATASDVLNVRRSLRLLTERWLAKGFNTWRIKEINIGLLGVSPVVRLPAGVDDVLTVNVRTSGGSEVNIRRISPAEYHSLTKPMTLGQPSQFYLDRATPPSLYVFPIGTPTSPTSLVVTYVARPAEFERYSVTDDVPGRWLEALTLGLALDLARKRPPYDEGLISRLRGEAQEAEDIAMAADRGRQRFRYRIG